MLDSVSLIPCCLLTVLYVSSTLLCCLQSMSLHVPLSGQLSKMQQPLHRPLPRPDQMSTRHQSRLTGRAQTKKLTSKIMQTGTFQGVAGLNPTLNIQSLNATRAT